jgi:hypothetical protein
MDEIKLAIAQVIYCSFQYASIEGHIYGLKTGGKSRFQSLESAVNKAFGKCKRTPLDVFEEASVIGKKFSKQHPTFFKRIIKLKSEEVLDFYRKYKDMTFGLEISQKSVAYA